MAKKVRYNGGTESYYGCSEPTDLVIGKEYEVVSERDRGWQTDLTLRGVSGEFNSAWFDEVIIDDHVYMAISNNLPEIGKRYFCFKISIKNGRPELIGTTTSRISQIKFLGNDVYKVTTENSVYFVTVG